MEQEIHITLRFNLATGKVGLIEPMGSDYHIDYTDSQLPVPDKYLYVGPQYLETFTA